MIKSTEQDSLYRHLEQMDTHTLLTSINEQDHTVALAVQKAIPQIESLVDAVHERLAEGGRLFYIGAGTSGRLGILDASECPPTFGVPHEMVIGLIAGGDGAIRRAVEHAEDSKGLAWADLSSHAIGSGDIVVGIAASGTTPYVVGGLERCQAEGIATGCIVCNAESPVAAVADYPVEVVVGPEFVTGSTRMKSGTAQKMVLNMLTTSVMIKLGRVLDNKMVDMQLSNDKLIDRGTRLIMSSAGLAYAEAREALLEYGSVREVLKRSR